jgi:LPS sulfotransferase NodH
MNTPYNRFIILSDARTGSNLLQQALNAHPAIVCFREIFNIVPDFIDYDVDGWEPRSAGDIELRARDPHEFLRQRVFCAHHASAVRAVGFKFHYDHFWFHADLLPTLIADDGLHVIHLQRRNQLRSFVSLKIAEQTGAWLDLDPTKHRRQTLARKLTWSNAADAARHPVRAVGRIRSFLAPVNAAPSHERQPLTLSHDECVAHFYRVHHQVEHFGNLFREHRATVITFEELVADRDRVLGAIYEFLNVAPAPSANTTLRRQNPEPLRELIANFEELRASFAGTEYEPWFDD